MGRRSSILSIPKDLRDDICADFRTGVKGDDLLAKIHAAGYLSISRASLYRFLHTTEELYKRYKLLADYFSPLLIGEFSEAVL
jgi:hypothetical protein